MSENEAPAMDHAAILKVAAHRYPFLMVDRILTISEDATAVTAIKNVSFNEPWTQGHFPNVPVFPGVMQIETMAQVGGILIIAAPENDGKLGLLTSVDKAKFRRSVHPGDQLFVETKVIKARHSIYEIECKCSVDGKLCSQAMIKFAVAEKQ